MTAATEKKDDLLPLIVGHVYRAKRPKAMGWDAQGTFYNDRQILYIDRFGVNLQYDGPAVADGRHYPMVSVEAFRKWAKYDLTEAANLKK